MIRRRSISRLRRLLFGPKSEKRKKSQTQISQLEVNNKGSGDEPSQREEKAEGASQSTRVADKATLEEPAKKKSRPGHGRHSALDFPGAKVVHCINANLHPGGRCPSDHCKGHLRDTKEPQILIKREARPIIDAIKYERQVLRCNRCEQRFVAQLPPNVTEQRYDTTADVMMAIMKYGAALPWYRLERLQLMMGIPLPASTQFERCEIVANALHPVFLELVHLAAQGELLHTDDTIVKILSCLKENKQLPEGERKGLYTTGIGARSANYDIVLYCSGRMYSGENLSTLLKKRADALKDPLVMGDAERKNWIDEFKKVICKCLAHGRRKFVDCERMFPGECERVLDDLAAVYEIDAQTKTMTAQERLQFHQAHSRPIMVELQVWLEEQLSQKIVEPVSSLGKAIKYMLDHWPGLTRFLTVAGAPLDNNFIERLLRRAVINRKNWLFYKTEHGAVIGDILASVIETCGLNQTNPFDYLITIMKNKKEVRHQPSLWLPWNYQKEKEAA
jgi:transposase